MRTERIAELRKRAAEIDHEFGSENYLTECLDEIERLQVFEFERDPAAHATIDELRDTCDAAIDEGVVLRAEVEKLRGELEELHGEDAKIINGQATRVRELIKERDEARNLAIARGNIQVRLQEEVRNLRDLEHPCFMTYEVERLRNELEETKRKI